MRERVKVEFVAKLPIKIEAKKKWYVASCPILDISSQGETESKAKKNLKEALVLFFTSCFERGILDAVLKNCGFTAIQQSTVKAEKRTIADKENYINIPIPFLVNQNSQTECHA